MPVSAVGSASSAGTSSVGSLGVGTQEQDDEFMSSLSTGMVGNLMTSMGQLQQTMKDDDASGNDDS